ncbi:hypothetical protein MNBD_GAMMA01-1590 [hydrothermal vent metagenome]|uniref:Fibronectin type-III domain-containing protein n=1 Tax=hydrothermal vent metagenome TaxID=652676 RepID=A0A3B0VT07_9ZZZZ
MKIKNELNNAMGVSTNTNVVFIWVVCLGFTLTLLLAPVSANAKNKVTILSTGESIIIADNPLQIASSDIIFRSSFEYDLTPTELSAVALGSYQVQLMWIAPEVNDVEGYRIFESGALIATTTTTAYLHVDLTPETSYSYTIEAFNTAGDNSQATTAESVTTPSETTMTALAMAASAMEPGDWITFTTENFDNGNILVTPDNGRITEFTTEAIWDPVARRVFIAGTAYGASGEYGMINQMWVQWSEATNAWTLLPQLPFYLGFHSYDHAALDSNTGDYYLRRVGSPQVRYYNPDIGNWGMLPDLPVNGSCCNALEYFADIDALVFTAGATNGNTKIFQYMKSSSSWQQLAAGEYLPMGNYHDINEYSATHGVLFFGGGKAGGSASGRELYSLDGSGNVMRHTDAPVPAEYGANSAITVADPNTGNLLLFHHLITGKFYEHVFSNDTWVAHDLPEGISMVADGDLVAVAAPIPEYDVIMFIKAHAANSVIYLYKHQP